MIDFGECRKTSGLGIQLFSPISVFLNGRERDNTAGSVGAGAWGVLSQMTAGSVGIGRGFKNIIAGSVGVGRFVANDYGKRGNWAGFLKK